MIEIQLYKDSNDQWRWRAVNTGNHKNMAGSLEGYHNETDVRSALEKLFADRHPIKKAAS